MEPADLELVHRWLEDPEVGSWFTVGSSLAEEVEELRRCISGEEMTEVLIASVDGDPIGWCQWYRCSEYPAHAEGVGAAANDIGIDYVIGESSYRSRGLGTELVAALVAHVHSRHPDAGIIADPEAANVRSRRVLERNGFHLIDERRVSSEPIDSLMAIYRLAPSEN